MTTRTKKTDYRKMNMRTLTTQGAHKDAPALNSVAASQRRDKIWKYYQLWSAMDKARKDRERNVRYGMGDQYSDMIIDENGRRITEKQHILNQGRVPIAHNLIRGNVNTILGQFRSNQTEPSCVARDRDEAKLGEMMSVAIQYEYQQNKLWELDSRTLHEYLHSGAAIHRVNVAWDMNRQEKGVKVDMVHFNRFFFNGNTEDPRGHDITVMGELMDIPLSELLNVFCKGDKEKALRLSKYYNQTLDNDHVESAYSFTRERINNLSFFMGERSLCRVIVGWEIESKERLQVHDYLTGEDFITELDQKNAIDRINAQRISEALSQGVIPEDVATMDYEWVVDRFWYVRYLTPSGEVLYEGETQFNHKRPPYVVKLSIFDGQIYSFVSDLIDLNRGVNRMATLVDFIISSSPKGVMVFPEEALGLMSKEEVEQQYKAPGGVIFAKLKNTGDAGKPFTLSQNATNVGAYDLLNLYMSSMKDVSGVYSALQGQKAAAGTPASLYAQQTEQSSINILDMMETFKSFRQDRDYMMLQDIQQYYNSVRYIGLAGNDYEQESKWYNPDKVKDVKFDLVINESSNTPAFRSMNNGLLLELFKTQAIGVKELLKAGNFPFGDKLLELISEQESAMEQGNVMPEVPQDIQAQMQANVNPQAQPMLRQTMRAAS